MCPTSVKRCGAHWFADVGHVDFGLKKGKARFCLFHLVPCGWFHTQQVLHEEVVAFVLTVGFAHGVVGTGDEDELEVLVGFDERVDHLVGRGGVNVVVHFAND